MRRLYILVFLLTLSLVAVADTVSLAQNFACQYAAGRNYKQIGAFADIIVPLWLHAFPNKDYAAIMNASPDIQIAGDAVVTMKVESRNHTKMKIYKERREKFLQQSMLYVDAVNKGDSARAYDFFDSLWTSFETLASTLLPIPYPAFEDFHAAVIRFVHVDNEITRNKIKKSAAAYTDTLAAKLQVLMTDSLPASSIGKPEWAIEEYAYFAKLIAKMKDQIALKDPLHAWEVANELDVRLNTFVHYYLD